MTYDIIEKNYTFSALVDKLKKELATTELNVENYLKEIKKYKKDRSPNQLYYDFKLMLDFSIDIEDKESIKKKIYDNRKYYYYAYFFLKIGVFRRNEVPIFWINLSDLSREMINEIKKLEPCHRHQLLKQAIGRIFEDINFDLYHDSISSDLRVGFG